MRKKLRKFLKNTEAVFDAANITLGLFMLTALIVFQKTGNRCSMFAVIFCGAGMNILAGWRFLSQKNRRQMGYSMILFGMVILMFGVIILLGGH